jgi:hypothetical protein
MLAAPPRASIVSYLPYHEDLHYLTDNIFLILRFEGDAIMNKVKRTCGGAEVPLLYGGI